MQLCKKYPTHLKRSKTSVDVIAEGLRRAEEDLLVGQLPQVLPVKPFAAACQLLNGGLQSGTP